MGSRLFKQDSFGKNQKRQGARWKPARDSGEYRLADELVTWFKEREPSRISFDKRVEDLSARLEAAADDFDTNTFLDALVLQVAENIDYEGISSIYNLIDPLLQALYLEGRDNLMLDLSPFPNMMPLPADRIYLAHNINGDETRKLSLQIFGDLYHVASSVQHCVIDCFSNISGTAASHAKDSEMTFHKITPLVGTNAERCVFRVPSRSSVPAHNPHNFMPKDCTYYVDQHIPEQFIESYKKKGFFAAGNTLFMRDHDNEWVKVNPDDY